MATPKGVIIRPSGSSSKPSGAFPSNVFDFGRMRDRLEFPDKVVP